MATLTNSSRIEREKQSTLISIKKSGPTLNSASPPTDNTFPATINNLPEMNIPENCVLKKHLTNRFSLHGIIHTSVRQENHTLHGPTRTFYTSGILKLEVEYKFGKLHGKRKLYDSNGNLKEVKNYTNGKKHGLSTKFNPDKSIRKQTLWENGKKKTEVSKNKYLRLGIKP